MFEGFIVQKIYLNVFLNFGYPRDLGCLALVLIIGKLGRVEARLIRWECTQSLANHVH